MKDGNEYNKKFYYLKKVSDHKYGFVCSRQFKADGIIDVQLVNRCVAFAHEMAFGSGEHRKNRSGGTKERTPEEIYVNTLQGKLAETALYDYLRNHKLKPSNIDFSVSGKGIWDTFDLACSGHVMNVKSTKYYGQLLLLEKADWDDNGNYIPNQEKGYDKYDEIVLIRINPDVEDVIKRTNSFWTWGEKEQEEFWKEQKYLYEFSGYITHEDLKYIIRHNYVIRKGDYIGKACKDYKGTCMDADNYYVQLSSMRKKEEFMKRIGTYIGWI